MQKDLKGNRPTKIIKRVAHAYLDNPSEVFPVHVVVSLEEHLAQPALADRVVLGVEFVKAVERVAVLGHSNFFEYKTTLVQ